MDSTCPADRPPAPPPRESSRSAHAALSFVTVRATPAPVATLATHVQSSMEDLEVDDLMLDDDLLLGDDDDDDDDVDCYDVGDVDVLSPVPATKHFLDYDSQPPPGLAAVLAVPSAVAVTDVADNEPDATSTAVPTTCHLYPGEARRVDKKYETDGEISDFELATYSQTMRARRAEKALSAEDAQQQQQQQQHLQPSPLSPEPIVRRRKKHFLDENPIPPENEATVVSSIPTATSSVRQFETREHRSLDRQYERSAGSGALTASTSNGSRRNPTSFALDRFLDSQDPPSTSRSPSRSLTAASAGTWPTDRNTSNQTHQQQQPGQQSPARQPPQATPAADTMGPKVECVYSLLSMLGCNDPIAMSRKFLELSQSPQTCAALRQSRCIPLIVQIIHSDEADEPTRLAASRALHNVVNLQPDDKCGRREAKVLRHIEHVMDYCAALKQMLGAGEALADDRDRHPLQAMSSLMKISFDEEHRHAMCQLGALQAIASVVQWDHAMHAERGDERCVALRRYAAMALTNLTFGDGNNKAALCANKAFMRAFVAQLAPGQADDLLPVTANVLRNLSWRADATMKRVLNEIGTVSALTRAVMRQQQESTIKALLSALWNLSAHCTNNKAEFCAVDGALAFLVEMLQYEGPSKTLTIAENAGGILRNVSCQVAVSERYRVILRERNCLAVLLAQLSSESLTIVSNACGTLWNLSARCAEDQQFLIDNRAVPRLSLLVHSKHKMISNGSAAALKNLMQFRPGACAQNGLDTVAKAMRLRELPQLTARKQRALAEGIDQTLGETCENIEATTPPKERAPASATTAAKRSLAAAGFGRLTQSEHGLVAVPRCESNSSLVTMTRSSNATAGSSCWLRPASHSLPPTPKRTNPLLARSAPPPSGLPVKREAARSAATPRFHDTPASGDQLTDFAQRYGHDADSTRTNGLESPEKCVRYADEGTPVGYQSLDAEPLATALDALVGHVLDDADELLRLETASETADSVHATAAATEIETPLMFSRHSSMGSLTSGDDCNAAGSDLHSAYDSEVPDTPMPPAGDESKIASDLCAKEGLSSLSSMDSGPDVRGLSFQPAAFRLGKTARPPLLDDPYSSIDSADSADVGGQTTALLQQCIQMGMHKPKRSQLPVICRATPAKNADLERSLHSLSDFSQMLDRSNEYPAGVMSASIATDATDASGCALNGSVEVAQPMERSNEFMLDAQEMNQTEEVTNLGDDMAGATATVASCSTISDKHRDPDLMLKSVDRLTQELVSTAEYLRSNAANASASSTDHSHTTSSTVYERKSSSSTTNTWNEDTCPNEVSFPSISWTAPVIAQDDDDADNTLSQSRVAAQEGIELQAVPASQPESLDTDTATLVNESAQSELINDNGRDDSGLTTDSSAATTGSGIRFQVGGPTFRDHHPHRLPGHPSIGYQLGAGRHYHFDASTASMTKSTIIALEANKLATDLLMMPGAGKAVGGAGGGSASSSLGGLGDSCNSLDFVDDIRPPSGMDTCSAYFESSQPNSMVAPSVSQPHPGAPLFSPQLARRKKSLPAGLMARRALHHFAVGGSGSAAGGGGSLESVHSSCNLENIKPPSIMDELMDSMISVASITSEVASADLSQYDTAVSQQLLRHDDDHDAGEREVGADVDCTEAPTLGADDEDDTTTLRSCFDMPFDGAGADQTPVGSDLSSAESTPVRKMRSIRRTLTLKQKRQATKERYRTYTIAADMMLQDSADEDGAGAHDDNDEDDDGNVDDLHEASAKADALNRNAGILAMTDAADVDEQLRNNAHTVQIEIVEAQQQQPTTPRLTQRQRRQEDRVRFQTQIIEPYHLDTLKQSPQHIGDITTSSGSNSLDDEADMSSIRALTERFRYIQSVANDTDDRQSQQQQRQQPHSAAPSNVVQLAPSVPHNNAHYSGTTHRPQLDTIVATEFDSLELTDNDHDNDHDGDVASIELQHEAIDECTYNVPAASVAPLAPPKPKIVKPTLAMTAPTAAEPPTPSTEAKAIRGKKKAAYVSPYRKSPASSGTGVIRATTASIGTAPAAKRPTTGISKLLATKNLAKTVAKTHVLLHKPVVAAAPPNRRPGALAKPGYTLTAASAAPTPAPAAVAAAAAPAMPERQGTFVKDEPSEPLLAASVPIVCSVSPVRSASKLPSKLPTTSPAKNAANPAPAFVSRLRNPLQRSASTTPTTAAASGSSPRLSATLQKSPAPDQTAAGATTKRRSVGSGGLGLTAPTPGFYRSPSTPSVPQRSNSQASLPRPTGATGRSPSIASQPPSRSNSNLSSGRPGLQASTSVTNVPSRIAGIWRRPATAVGAVAAGADSNKQQTKNQVRSSAASAAAATGPARLIRSSTFDNTPEPAASSGGKQQPTAATAIVAPLRRRPNGQTTGATAAAAAAAKAGSGETAAAGDKKRLSRLGANHQHQYHHYHNLMVQLPPRLY